MTTPRFGDRPAHGGESPEEVDVAHSQPDQLRPAKAAHASQQDEGPIPGGHSVGPALELLWGQRRPAPGGGSGDPDVPNGRPGDEVALDRRVEHSPENRNVRLTVAGANVAAMASTTRRMSSGATLATGRWPRAGRKCVRRTDSSRALVVALLAGLDRNHSWVQSATVTLPALGSMKMPRAMSLSTTAR
jgi:hypothetical protein